MALSHLALALPTSGEGDNTPSTASYCTKITPRPSWPYAEIRKYSIKWCNAQRDHQQFDGISRDKLSVIAYIFSSQPSSGISLANWSRSDDARRA